MSNPQQLIQKLWNSLPEVERWLSVVEELETLVSANLKRATRLRQSILRKAFTGQLVKPT
jgi:type I restriction enzyme S subunit